MRSTVGVDDVHAYARRPRRAPRPPEGPGRRQDPCGHRRLRERIRVNRVEIAALNGRLHGLRNRADNTVLPVTLTARGPERAAARAAPPAAPGRREMRPAMPCASSRSPQACCSSHWRWPVPLGLLVVPALLGTRIARRRRREHAPDAV
jgi:hypothetical protein